jgi:uncharacterized protein (TIGR01777 family)
MRVLISGSSGLIGSALHHHLTTDGHDVVRLVRSEPAPGEVQWSPEAGELDPSVFDGVDAVVNLSGAGVGDKRWTPARKAEIMESRVDSTRLLAETMAGLAHPPAVFLSSSAIGYYGDRGDEVLTEASKPGPSDDFLVQVTMAWEAAAQPAADAGIRTVNLRTGIVLDASAGALGKMLFPFKLGIGGKLGDGSQWWSWISLEDEVRAVTHLLDSPLAGPVNLTAPKPATNAEVTKVIGSTLGRPTLLPVPGFALDLLLGKELAHALAFTSARVLPERLLADGFVFRHEELTSGVAAALGEAA